jgi:hypothetical protein
VQTIGLEKFLGQNLRLFALAPEGLKPTPNSSLKCNTLKRLMQMNTQT